MAGILGGTSTTKKGVIGSSSGTTGILGKTSDIGTSQNLYNLAKQQGLQGQADKLLKQKGEDANKIFSGGWISDTFDVLNMTDYGIVGMLKGKTFEDGVKNRESFADEDSLGKYGLPGIIGGTILDIAVDPLTYIAPATIIKKIPGAEKVLKGGLSIASKTPVAKWLGEKFVYGFGKDKAYLDLAERTSTSIIRNDNAIKELVDGVINIPKEKAGILLKTDDTGRFVRNSLDDIRLNGGLDEKELANVEKSFTKLDNLTKEAIDLKILNKEKAEEELGRYIKNAYTEYETAKKGALFPSAKAKVKGTKARVEGLTTEQMKELGQIDNPSYLLFKSMIDLNHDIENVKFFNQVAKQFSSVDEIAGFTKLPETKRFFTSSTGEKIASYTKIKGLNEALKEPLKNLKLTFKGDRKVLGEINGLTKQLDELSKLREDEFYKFFSEGNIVEELNKERKIIGGVERLPETLRVVGSKIEKFIKPTTELTLSGKKFIAKDFKTFFKSDVGIEVEKLYREGVLERNGFKNPQDLFNFIKNKYEKIPESISEKTLTGNIQKLINIQKQIEKLTPKLEKVKNIDKRSIDDSYRFLEDTINKIRMEKEDIFENIGKIKLGELGGKYVPDNIHKDLMEMFATKSDTEKKLEKIMHGFKFGKVVLNPATHVRNVMSNMILNWWKLGIGPWRADLYGEAMGEILKGSGKWIKEAKTAGYGLDTFAANEISNLLTIASETKVGKVGNWMKKQGDKMARLYQNEENLAKLTAFIQKRKSGIGIEEAWKAAESATFNYAQVTPFVRKLRTSLWGSPFITFTAKATPVALETIYKHPQRVSSIGKIKNSIEKLSNKEETTKERANEPSWMRNGFYIKLPWKDEQGRSAYFDLTYILPFGDLVSGNIIDQKVSRETGLPEGLPMAIASNSPLINTIKELTSNQDFSGNSIWKDSSSQGEKIAEIMRYLTKTYLPPAVADQIPGGFKADGTRAENKLQKTIGASEENMNQNLMESMLNFVGMKIQPIDADIQSSYMESERKKALRTLLVENGAREFKNVYIPK
jgi:CRISPR/Cas system CSM-associated protein Csm2 small subunit